MATVYKIHPAIGIARVGNSSDEFFIGPERVGEHEAPAGGYKDDQCRVKRQAARFHIFAHHDDGTVGEITDAEAEITWTVHLANKKAANPGRGNTEPAADLTIDPGPRTLTGPDQREVFDTGEISFSGASTVTVPLGEIRSDDVGHLLVLGGFGTSASPLGTSIGHFWGNDDWYDDVSDGPVTATIQFRATGDTPPVVGAWAIVAPPKFAPQLTNVITLYDRVFAAMVDAGLATAPTTTSYTQDVYPILQRARDIHWVEGVGSAHAWVDPVTGDAQRNAIFNRLSAPGGAGADMPDLNDSGTGDNRLTEIQYDHMERWRDGTYTDDWVGVPAPEVAISPDGLDRAALEQAVGGAFFRGIEAGGLMDGSRPIIAAANYAEAFRLDHAVVSAGDISSTMALPWQADFLACADNWWPVPRPNDVTPQGETTAVKWDRDIPNYEDMVAHWHTLGFIVRQGSQYVEVDRCEVASIQLVTPHLDFHDVPQGPLGMVREQPLAITFEVIAPSGAVTLEYAPGGAPTHPQLVAYNTTVTIGPTAASEVAMARFWIIYRTGPVGAIPLQTVTIQDAAGGQSWSITISGNTVARKTAAVALVLDRSGSMSEDRGDGESKHTSLQQAAGIFVDVMVEGDGVGVVRYNQDAQALQSVLQLGSGGLSDVNRGATKDLINGPALDPLGSTSIGDGIFEGRGILTSAPLPYDVKALAVLTDGKENSPLYIADVAAQINEQTFAIGFGTPQNTSAAALQTISGNNGGFLLVTGAIGQDNRFLLQKYFLQILAGVTSAEIVLDPAGTLVPGVVQRIPFDLTEADAGVDVILLTPDPRIVDFRLQTPTGLVLEPWRAQAEPGMRYVLSNGVSYYRLVLPIELVPNRFNQAGTWQALLTIGRPRLGPTTGRDDGVDDSILRGRPVAQSRPALSRRRMLEAQRAALIAAPEAAQPAAALQQQRLVPYSLMVHSYSSLSLQATAQQASFEPGARARLNAILTESGLPVSVGRVWAEVRGPNRVGGTVALRQLDEGRFGGDIEMPVPGVYHIRLRARGRTRRGLPFTRERALTPAVWHGGDRPPGPGQPEGGQRDGASDQQGQRLLELLADLARGGTMSADLERRLRDAGVDLDRARETLRRSTQLGEAERGDESG